MKQVQVLRWLLLAVNAYPFNDTDEARYKAKALIEVADRLDKADEKAKAKNAKE
jgi:hypothetical protein